MQNFAYEKLKNFQRVKSLKDILRLNDGKSCFEDETILKIKENIFNYKKREQERLRKIEVLTQLLNKIEEKTIHNKFSLNK